MNSFMFSEPRNESWTTLLHVCLFIGLFQLTISSDCDVEFIYSEYLNSNGFKVTCKNIRHGEENIVKYISAHNAILLYIKNATLANVANDLFENVPKLRELTIEDSKVDIPGEIDLFSKLEFLQSLHLKNTELRTIGNGTFYNLHQLKTLHLENNSISTISKDSLILGSLENFKFMNNELKDLKQLYLCDLPNIRTINLSWNKLSVLEQDLYRCIPNKLLRSSKNSLGENDHSNLESLDLGHNSIETIHDIFKSLKSLTHLNLQNNSIVDISDSDFEFLVNLEYLNLAHNQISSISKAAFTRLHHIRSIDLSSNRIRKIKLKLLGQLTDINLAHNELTFNNLEDISHLPRLRNLDLSYNDLRGSSLFFNRFSSLKSLNLNENNIILEDGMFSNLSRLEILYLNGNGILHLPSSLFKNLSSLVQLDLSNNKLGVFDDNEIFSPLVNLQKLNLSHNSLRDLNYTLFMNLNDVEVLDVSGNELKYLDYALIITNMRALETINIKDNSFSCNILHRMVRYFSWKGVNYRADEMSYYDEENIGGIHCQEEDVVKTKNGAVGMTSDMHYRSTVEIILISVVCAILLIVLILVTKYVHFYRRRKYRNEQFELIED